MMPRLRIRRRTFALGAAGMVGVVVVGGLVAAAARQRDPGDDPSRGSVERSPQQPAVGAVPVVTDWRQITLPLDGYALSSADAQAVLNAEYQQTSACMERFGLEFDAPAWVSGTSSTATAQPTHYRLYGLLDAEHAAREGYHNSGIENPIEQKYSEQSHSHDYDNVVAAKFGGGTYNGRPIPDGGCIAEARRIVEGPQAAVDTSMPEQLAVVAWQQSNNDTRVVAGFLAWSACMKQAGFDYATPMDANNDPRWSGSVASKDEITVASADVACKKQTNLTGVRMAVDAAYEKVAIQDNAARLAALETAKEASVQKAKSMLATAAG